jgi:hypothetical protein
MYNDFYHSLLHTCDPDKRSHLDCAVSHRVISFNQANTSISNHAHFFVTEQYLLLICIRVCRFVMLFNTNVFKILLWICRHYCQEIFQLLITGLFTSTTKYTSKCITYIHTHIHTRTHTYMHTHIHTYTHACTRVHTHTHTRTRTHTRTQGTHARTRAHTHIYIHTYRRPNVAVE